MATLHAPGLFKALARPASPVATNVVLGTAVLVLLAAVAVEHSWRLVPAGGDLLLYAEYGGRIVAGDVPYRDFFLEYPPGALPEFALPAVGDPDPDTYAARFASLMIAVAVAGLACMSFVLRRLRSSTLHHAAALGVVALSPVLLGPIEFKRYDWAPATLTVAVVALAVAGRLRWAAVAAGVAITVKLYPVVLVPVLVLAGWRSGGRREAAAVTASLAAALLVVAVPFVALAPHGVYDSVRFQLERSLQMETVVAGVLLAIQSVTDVGVRLVDEAQTQRVAGTLGETGEIMTTVAFLIALAYVWRRAWRLVATPPGLVLSSVTCVCVAVALARVLSTQFVVWLLPLAPLAPGWWGVAAAGLLAATCLFTRLWYDHYQAVVDTLERSGIALLVTRNALLVAMLGVLLVAVARARPAAAGDAAET